MRVEAALLSLTRKSQANLIERQRSKEGYKAREQNTLVENANEGPSFPWLGEASSGDVEIEKSSKSVWYPKECDRDI
jgi:hypothetical protein